jgi:hypothetical protein
VTNASSFSGLSILDCHLVLSNIYLLPIVCPVSCVTNVSSISGLSILDCRSVFSNVYLLHIVCPVSCVTNVSSISGLSILDCRSVLSSGNHEWTIQRYWKHWSHQTQDIQ